MTVYEPNHMEGLASGGTTVDLENRELATPVGNFRIISFDDRTVSFDDPRSDLGVFGTLDRITGQMTVIWRRAGASQMSRYANLQCGPARRLF